LNRGKPQGGDDVRLANVARDCRDLNGRVQEPGEPVDQVRGIASGNGLVDLAVSQRMGVYDAHRWQVDRLGRRSYILNTH
jgi:hypothetical protein